MTPGRSRKKQNRAVSKTLDEKLLQARKDIETVQQQLNSADPCSDLAGLVSLMKATLRTVDSAVFLAREFFVNVQKHNGSLQDRVKKFWRDYDLENWGFAYDKTLDPIDNLITALKAAAPRMRDGRLFIERVRKASELENDDALLAAARTVHDLPERSVPAELVEEIERELQSAFGKITPD